jgi:hypothetical protein
MLSQNERDLMNKIADLERRLEIQESNENRLQLNFLSFPIRLVGPPNTSYGAFPALVAGVAQYFCIEGTWTDGTNTVTVPHSAQGIIGALTVIAPAAAGNFITIFPANIAAPTLANLTWQVAGVNVGGLVMSQLGVVPAGHIPVGAGFDGRYGVGIKSNVNCSIAFDAIAYTN